MTKEKRRRKIAILRKIESNNPHAASTYDVRTVCSERASGIYSKSLFFLVWVVARDPYLILARLTDMTTKKGSFDMRKMSKMSVAAAAAAR